MDIHNPGVLSFFMGNDQQCYSVRVTRTGRSKQERIFYWIMFTLGCMVPPLLLHITWRKQMTALQQVKESKVGPAVMWACIAWMPLANLYMAAKFTVSFSHFAVDKQVQESNDTFTGTAMAYVILISGTAALIQSGQVLPGLPNTCCSVLQNSIVRRVVKLYIWYNFNFLMLQVLARSPFVVLLVGTNPFLYGSALLAIVLATSLPIFLTATLFTIGQVFLEDPGFRLTWREAVRQAGWLLLVATGCVGVALFLGCICFLLLLSKDGNKVQSVSGVASFLMRHVVLTSLPLLMHSLIRFIRNIWI